MNTKSKNITFVLMVLLLFAISYARDTLFILLNAAVEQQSTNYANIPTPDFLKNLDLPQLKKLKWTMAIVFSVSFMFISTIAIHLYFGNRYFTRLVIILYLVLGVTGLAAELLKHTVKLPLLISRIIHIPETIIQSPLVLLLLFSSLLFYTLPVNK